MQKSPAFTLIEILVVATIIIVLTTISIASFSTASKSARDAKRKSDMETMRQAMVLWKTQEGAYPTGAFASLAQQLIDGVGTPVRTYLSPPAPTDPKGGSYVSSSSTTSTFCFCALMENNTKGNSTAGCTFSGTTHYCVRQP